MVTIKICFIYRLDVIRVNQSDCSQLAAIEDSE